MNVLTHQIEESTVSKEPEVYQKIYSSDWKWMDTRKCVLATVGTNGIIRDMIFPNIMFFWSFYVGTG